MFSIANNAPINIFVNITCLGIFIGYIPERRMSPGYTYYKCLLVLPYFFLKTLAQYILLAAVYELTCFLLPLAIRGFISPLFLSLWKGMVSHSCLDFHFVWNWASFHVFVSYLFFCIYLFISFYHFSGWFIYLVPES